MNLYLLWLFAMVKCGSSFRGKSFRKCLIGHMVVHSPSIGGEDLRDGSEFRLTEVSHRKTSANFIAISNHEIIVTRRLSDILDLPQSTEVLANWHGERRTDLFRTNIGMLRNLDLANVHIETSIDSETNDSKIATCPKVVGDDLRVGLDTGKTDSPITLNI